jgi:NAD(P)-dependent dehydrogenase (short-subunit alcohol dehydrogenase family)
MGVIVVTGGSSDVGRATCRELAKRGHALAVLARGTRHWRKHVASSSAWGRATCSTRYGVTRLRASR